MFFSRTETPGKEMSIWERGVIVKEYLEDLSGCILR